MFTRTTGSFGPIFAERALTVGRKKLNFGINYMRATFDEFEGLELRSGDIKFFTDFGNLVFGEDSLTLKVSTDTVGFFLNYGLTDRLDVGLAMPLVRVDMDASLRFIFVNRQGTQVGDTDEIRSGGRSKTGFGDTVAARQVQRVPAGGRRCRRRSRSAAADRRRGQPDRHPRHPGQNLRRLLGGVRQVQPARQRRLHVLARQRGSGGSRF